MTVWHHIYYQVQVYSMCDILNAMDDSTYTVGVPAMIPGIKDASFMLDVSCCVAMKACA